MKEFLQEDQYIDYSSETIQNKVIELFASDMTEIKKQKWHMSL